MRGSGTRIIAAAVAGMAVGLLVQTAPAGMVVSPLKQEVTVKPGRTATFYVSLSNRARNPQATPLSAHLEVMDFAVNEAGAVVFKPPGTLKNSASNWITLTKADVTLEPDRGEEIECTINAPYSAAGEYYSAIVVTMGRKSRTASGVHVDFRIASGVFVTVPGRTFPKRARVASCEVVWPGQKGSRNLFPEGPEGCCAEKVPGTFLPEPLKVVAVLQNTGQARFEAAGQVRISNSQGRTVFKGPMTTKRARVLGGDTRRFECVLDKPLPPCEYTVRVEFDYGSQWGKAQARLPLVISAEQSALLAKAAETGPPTPGKAPGAAIEVVPKALAAKVPPGGFRSLKLTIKNTGQETVRCKATVVGPADAPSPASWILLTSDTFVLAEARSKNLPLVIIVPSEAAGSYKATLVLEVGEVDGDRQRIEVPIELTVKGGKG